jgi:hypothetical protein
MNLSRKTAVMIAVLAGWAISTPAVAQKAKRPAETQPAAQSSKAASQTAQKAKESKEKEKPKTAKSPKAEVPKAKPKQGSASQPASEKTDAKATPAPAAKDPQSDARFVDRDGDGLRDGQEHRFRSRRRDDGRAREAGETTRVFRARYRYGINGNAPGPQGRRGK